MPSSRPITRCQICDGDTLRSILFLGYVPPVNTMPPVGAPAREEAAYPLELMRCDGCGLVQIGLEVDATVLFPESYPYLSGSTRILRENFAQLRNEAVPIVGLEAGDLVVDIGSNDGTLLGNFRDAGCRVLGIEPSQAADVARRHGIETLTAYFGRDTAAAVRRSHGPAKLVTAANVFAHIARPHEVVDAVVDLMAPGGVFVSESHYLLDLVETLQYDTIYHEHLRYYALGSLAALLERHGLEVFDVRRIPTHGGSIRVYAARRGERVVAATVRERLADEGKRGIADGAALAGFRARALRSKLELHALIAPLKAAGASIVGIGAPSRASTLINYVGLDDAMLDAVLEISTSHKLDKYIPGTRIPVKDERLLFEQQPDYALLLSWHIADELVANLRAKGYRGRFIVPLPEPRIVA